MPDVESVRETPAAEYNSFSFSKKIITEPETHSAKQLLVTLKQDSLAKEPELAGLSQG